MSTETVTSQGMRVTELARAADVPSNTVRYYERIGLLPRPPRTPAGYRAYDSSAVDRIQFIQGAQRLGLRLRDIGDLLAIRDSGVCPCEPAEQLLRRRLTELDAEVDRLTRLRTEMVTMLDALPSADCRPPTPGPGTRPARGEVSWHARGPDPDRLLRRSGLPTRGLRLRLLAVRSRRAAHQRADPG